MPQYNRNDLEIAARNCRSIIGMIWKLQHGISISQEIRLKKCCG